MERSFIYKKLWNFGDFGIENLDNSDPAGFGAEAGAEIRRDIGGPFIIRFSMSRSKCKREAGREEGGFFLDEVIIEIDEKMMNIWNSDK